MIAKRAPAFVPVIHAARPDRPDEQDTVTTAHEIAAALARSGHRSEVIDLGHDLAEPLRALARRRPLAVFNMVETVDGDPTRAAEPAYLMAALGLRHTGCGAAALEAALSKTESKRLLLAAGVPTPPCWGVGNAIPPAQMVIVKSDSEHASLGIDAGSVVPGARAAAEIAAREARHGGRFFAEAFIDGREFNVAVLETAAGPRVLPIAEILFNDWPADQPRIVDYAAKWDTESFAYSHTPRHFGLEANEPTLAAELVALSRAAWNAFGLGGYARVDFRVDDAGRPSVLEINTNPCLATDAGFAAAAAEAGFTYHDLIAGVLAAARKASRKAV